MIDVCRRANPRLVIKRARFSALVRGELVRSMAQLAAPDENASRAVDARQELDLRIGASFTRFQTLLLQARHVSGGGPAADGPCCNVVKQDCGAPGGPTTCLNWVPSTCQFQGI